MTTPKISVIMPVYNAEKYITEAVESILEQTYSNFEFIIVDDCSTDHTCQILKKFQNQDDRIILVKNEYNRRQAFSRNRAINMANGKYIAFIDADDIARPERLQIQLDFLELNPNIGVCGSFYHLFNANNVKFKQNPPITHSEIECHMRLFGNCIAFPSVLASADIIKKIMFDEDMEGNAEDYELWIRMLDNGVIFWNIPEYLLYYRVHGSQASQTNIKQIYSFVNSVRHKALKKLFPNWDNTRINDALLIMMTNKLSLDLFRYFILIKKIYRANVETKYFDNKVFKKVLNDISVKKRVHLKLRYLLLRVLDKK